jgi:hypothetical protein
MPPIAVRSARIAIRKEQAGNGGHAFAMGQIP